MLDDHVLLSCTTLLSVGEQATPAAKYTGNVKPVPVRHFTNKKGWEGIQETQIIKASDQNSVFTVRAKGKPGGAREVENELGIKRGRGCYYVEFDAYPGEFKEVHNYLTKAIEYVFKGDVDLAGRNPKFYENR
jgi:HYD1 signature containing ADP-ribosyltransferase